MLEQLQREQEEKNQFFQDERNKEIARLNEEQKELERQAKIHQEVMLREQELHRQREAEKKKKELERIEEIAKQRELQRLREAREKQEQERRRLAEMRAKEEKRRQEQETQENLARMKEIEAQREAERQRELERHREIERQKELERQRLEEETRRNESYINQAFSHLREDTRDERPHAQPLIRDQQHHQHLTEVTKNLKSNRRNRLRPKIHQHQDTDYQDDLITTTTPSPNQPPLSVYMGTTVDTRDIKITDVLQLLKGAKTIAVLDNFGPNAPKVFIGPAYLDPPSGYAKFDLPYLSSIENNRVERKVDKLPFFVAPLSFEPPPGYSKIPFPAPHIGSVVVNTIDINSEADRYQDNRNPSPAPLIEPNSYVFSSQQTPSYETATTPSYTQDTFGSTRYNEPSTPNEHFPSKLKYKFFTEDKPSTQYYQESKTPSVVTASTYQDERPLKHKHHFSTVPTTTSYRESSFVTPSYQSNFPQSTPRYQEDFTSDSEAPVRGQKYDPQLALINQEQEQQGYQGQYTVGPTGPSTGNTYYTTAFDHDNRQSVGPNQYNLPAELPAISPQLPGLVNALMEKHEDIHPLTTTTPTTTTTTTTTEAPTTTIRGRGRQR